jgi:hypothetical protein
LVFRQCSGRCKWHGRTRTGYATGGESIRNTRGWPLLGIILKFQPLKSRLSDYLM